MNFRLQNTQLTAIIKDQGAELISLTDHERTEYIWEGDPKHWGRHTPVLFPLVGKVTGNQYEVDGHAYTLGQHGFARDCTFKVEHQTDTSITFVLTSDEATHKLYPYDFTLKITYTLTDTDLDITYTVLNTDEKTIFFKIGAHPAFKCPLFEDECFEDYTLTFEKEEQATQMLLNEAGYFKRETASVLTTPLALTHDLFHNDALVYTNYTSNSMTLSSNNHTKQVKVTFKDFPYLGIWTPQSPAPFVCIEPWCGHADYEDEKAPLSSKTDLNQLEPQETFTRTHTFTIQTQ